MTTECDAIRKVLAGDLTAWIDLVRRHTPLVWVVARSFRLDRSDAADAVQNTWIALAEYLPRLTRPDRLRAWLATTARRESLRVQERRGKERPADCVDERERHQRAPEPRALLSDRDRALWSAFDALPDRCRKLLALHANAPELSHIQLAAALEMHASSVGSTRSRCLDHLRRLLEAQDLHTHD